jgi:ribonucleotide monophosphatase NagD (HAD superfamily)
MGIAPEESIVIGDDLEGDIGGASRAGCAGVLVRTGKFRPKQLETSSVHPDRVLDSLADLPDLLAAGNSGLLG